MSALEAQDVDMMEVDAPAPAPAPTPAPPKVQLFATLKPVWVKPPANPGNLEVAWTAETATQQQIIKFLARWPPSRTPSTYGAWISGSRGWIPSSGNIAGLAEDFERLKAAGNVSVDSIDQISKANGMLGGKWMVFEESGKIDMLWGKILFHVCAEREKGAAKVSTWKEGEKHVICIYVADYTDTEDVTSLRQALRKLGVKWRIGFKTDAYTLLNIYKDNPWKLRPSRFHE